MKYKIIIAFVLFCSPVIGAKEMIVLDHVSLTMREVLFEAGRQTGLKMDIQVQESQAFKVFYDCRISLDNLLKAVKGYYKGRAGLNLHIERTEDGYWLGFIADARPVFKPMKPKTKRRGFFRRNGKTLSQKIKKNMKKPTRDFRNFFGRLRKQIKVESSRDRQTKDAILNTLRYSRIKKMDPVKKPNPEIEISPRVKNSEGGLVEDDFFDDLQAIPEININESEMLEVEIIKEKKRSYVLDMGFAEPLKTSAPMNSDEPKVEEKKDAYEFDMELDEPLKTSGPMNSDEPKVEEKKDAYEFDMELDEPLEASDLPKEEILENKTNLEMEL